MLAGHIVESDGKTWKLTLREGLLFHSGDKVLARDCVASIKRWGARDAFGQAPTSSRRRTTRPSCSALSSPLRCCRMRCATGAIMPEHIAETRRRFRCSNCGSADRLGGYGEEHGTEREAVISLQDEVGNLTVNPSVRRFSGRCRRLSCEGKPSSPRTCARGNTSAPPASLPDASASSYARLEPCRDVLSISVQILSHHVV